MMTTIVRRKALWLALVIVGAAASASAEPMFLAKQYTRCTPCHYSPTGGGLLTPYGRLLSSRELSTFAGNGAAPAAGDEDDPHGQQAFLYGALGNALGPVHLGLEMRPSHLRVSFPGGHLGQNLLMNLDLIGAVQKNGWTAYASAGREPAAHGKDARFISYEHWIGYQRDEGFGIRAGRFLPAYGVRFADHTAFTRTYLGFDHDDQLYGVEVSDTMGPSLLQVTLGAGRAESILDDDGHQAFSVIGRWQLDLRPRTTLIGSAAYRHSTDLDPKSGLVGAAFGFAPTSRLSVWTEVNGNLQTTAHGGRSWVAVNETAFEAYRGVWLKFSPQLKTSGGVPGFSELRRLLFEVDLLPVTHWNVDVSYYHDHNHTFEINMSTLLAQLHLYL
jgi:hypothetical protein